MDMSAWSPRFLAALRIVTALLFLQHGLMKLIAFPGPQPDVPSPLPMLLLIASLIELVTGTLMALGLFTRLAAFIAAGEMAIGYFLIHAPRGFWPGLNGGDVTILVCFVFLYLAAAGGGSWSLDTIRTRAQRVIVPDRLPG